MKEIGTKTNQIKEFCNKNTPYYKDTIVSYNGRFYKTMGFINKAYPGYIKAIKINVNINFFKKIN